MGQTLCVYSPSGRSSQPWPSGPLVLPPISEHLHWPTYAFRGHPSPRSHPDVKTMQASDRQAFFENSSPHGTYFWLHCTLWDQGGCQLPLCTKTSPPSTVCVYRKCTELVTQPGMLCFQVCRQHGHRYKQILLSSFTYFQLQEEDLDVSQTIQFHLFIFWPSSRFPSHTHMHTYKCQPLVPMDLA